jgi:excisionase family DNA binding protein
MTSGGPLGDDPYLTVAEVAGLLKLNQQTIRNWIDQGQLPASRAGRRVRIHRDDLEALLASGSTNPSATTRVRPVTSIPEQWLPLATALTQAIAASTPTATAAALDELADAARALARTLTDSDPLKSES